MWFSKLFKHSRTSVTKKNTDDERRQREETQARLIREQEAETARLQREEADARWRREAEERE